MNLLAIDTAAGLCAACVYDTARSRELGRCVRDLGTGHAEQLVAVVDAALAAAGLTYQDLGGVAVSVGPGSFTGVRVGVATARGLALALGIPATGVSTLDALGAETRAAFPGRAVLVAIDARRGTVYLARYDAGGALAADPAVMPMADAAAMLGDDDIVLVGSGAPLLADTATGRDSGPAAATADIATYAALAASRGFSGGKPKPLYLRAPDAKPQDGFALARRLAE